MSEARMSRRQVLKGLGALGAGALLACSPAGTFDNSRPPPEKKPMPQRLPPPSVTPEVTRAATAREKLIQGIATAVQGAELPDVIDGTRNLIEYIQRLPESPIKRVLTKRVIEKYYQSQPRKLILGNTDVLVHGVGVDARYIPGTVLDAYFKVRYNIEKQQPLRTTREARIQIPMVGLVFDHDKPAIPKEWILSDGTVTFPVNIIQGANIREGIRPTIIIKSPHPSFTGNLKDFYAAMERFTYVKEACNFVLFDLWIEKVFAKMQELQLPITVETAIKPTEVVTSLLDYIDSKKGRYVAAFDLAAYVLAIKAFDGSPDRKFLAQDAVLSQFLPHAEQIAIGTTEDKLLFDSLWQAATNPELHKLVHNGEITAFP